MESKPVNPGAHQHQQRKKKLMDRQIHVHTQTHYAYHFIFCQIYYIFRTRTETCCSTAHIDLYLRKWIQPKWEYIQHKRIRKLYEFSKSASGWWWWWGLGWWCVLTHMSLWMNFECVFCIVYNFHAKVAPITQRQILAYSWRLISHSRIQRTCKL